MKVARVVCQYIIRLGEELRSHREIEVGLSNRATIALTRMAQSIAYLNGHSAVFPDDVQRSFVPVLAHRLVTGNGDPGTRDRSMQRRNTAALLQAVMEQVPVD